MRTLRLQLRFLLPLVATLVAAAYLALPLMDRLTLRWFARDLSTRGNLVANTLSDSIAEALAEGRPNRLRSVFNRAVQDERLVAIAFCEPGDRLAVASYGFPTELGCAQAREAAQRDEPQLSIAGGPVHAGIYPVQGEAGAIGELVLLHDLSFIERRSQDTRRYLIGLITALGVGHRADHDGRRAARAGAAGCNGARALMRGEGLLTPARRPAPELAAAGGRTARPPARPRGRVPPLAGTRGRVDGRSGCARCCAPSCSGDQVIVVSNREPYIHERGDGGDRRQAPGQRPRHRGRAGDARLLGHLDRARQRRRRPRGRRRGRPRRACRPGTRSYTLRRIWLTPEEEQRLLLRLRQRGPVAAVPRGPRAAGVPRIATGSATATVNQRFADAVVAGGAQRRPGGAGAGLPLRAAAAR
ncbi:MAG: hypothetical protein MZW92_70375 [Comamonadaceae bacterium]|nr:hypothetical protein [Comamonadaceae bacterium]